MRQCRAYDVVGGLSQLAVRGVPAPLRQERPSYFVYDEDTSRGLSDGSNVLNNDYIKDKTMVKRLYIGLLLVREAAWISLQTSSTITGSTI